MTPRRSAGRCRYLRGQALRHGGCGRSKPAADRARAGVLTLQNGVDSTETLARVLGAACVIGGVAQIASVIAGRA